MSLSADLQRLLAEEPVDLARAALVIARLEQPTLDEAETLRTLDRMGDAAAARMASLPSAPLPARLAEFSRFLYRDEGFTGNRDHYDDYRNSLLNVVIERRTGIPISLALVYIHVARRAGLDVAGVAFPGHFLVRAAGPPGDVRVILDPFDEGALLDEPACRALFARHVGDEVPFDLRLLDPCSPRLFVARMLNNLKRTYVLLRSFALARRVTDLLLAVDPTLHAERRDRGLLAYHLDDFPAALRDLGDYLKLNEWSDTGDGDDRARIEEHVRALRRRVASLN
jgi:regulator of sirC expression with transglutaminase-like and TPR domain